MGPDPLVGPVITAATNVGLRFFPDVEGMREAADDRHDNRERLRYEIRLLTARRDDVLEEIERSKVTKMKKKTSECDAWLKTVQLMTDKAQKLDAKFLRITSNHYITNPCFSKAKLSKKMKKKADEIASLRGAMTPDKAMICVAPTLRFSKLSSEEMDEFPWIKRNVDDIWTLLQDKRLKKIGVYAFVGMGKTTIMYSLHDKARKHTELFRHVIFVPVQDKDSEETIQKCIMDQLDIDLNDIRSPNLFSATISRALQDEKYLLLIDQLAEKIDLKKLGIHDNHNGRKVVVATRYKPVCTEMGMDKTFQVRHMLQEDIWNMFSQIAGHVVAFERIKPLAKLIAKECGGNPFLIKSVATYLKDKGENEEIWSDCKFQLQSCRHPYTQSFDDAYNVFKLLFDKLTDSRKGCLLYGALFPQNHEIYADYLMECWRAEDFIPYAGGSNNQQIFRRARGDGHYAMEQLIDSGLLERSTTGKFVKMPFLFRKWAFKTDDGTKMLVSLSDEEERNYPQPEHRGERTRISLKCSNLSKFLVGVSADKISTLLLQRNERLDSVLPLDSIFARASQLRVLDFGYTGITSVPPSIPKLTRLKALYLNNCRDLSALPTKIKELTDLEVLDISRTGIPSWPAEIGNLSGLKCLRVSFVENVVNSNQATDQWFFPTLKKIFSRDHTVFQTTNIISKLHQLEELTIFVDDSCPSWWTHAAEAVVRELVSLKVLTTLCFYFPTVNLLEYFIKNSLSWKNIDNTGGARPFRSFKIVVGSSREENRIDWSNYKAERHLKVFAPVEPLEEISSILKEAYTFELIDHQNIEHLAGLGIENMAGLKICAIQGCCNMRSIIRTDNNTRAVVLGELERLHLFNLRKLITIFDGQLEGGSFANLSTLTIDSCQKLSVILPLELARHVPQLEYLRVENCFNARSIIERDRHAEEREKPLDSNLKKLELINLPNLGWIDREITMKWPALKELEVDECDRLRDFPLVVTAAMRLTWFRCKHSLWNQLSEECRSRPHLFHSAIDYPDPINNNPDGPPQQEEQRRNGLNPNN